MMRKFLASVVVLALVAVVGRADETKEIKGVVTKVGEDSIVVKAEDQEHTVKVTDKTKFLDVQGNEMKEGLKSKPFAAAAQGGRITIMVTIKLVGDAKEPTAEEIKLSGRGLPRPAPGKPVEVKPLPAPAKPVVPQKEDKPEVNVVAADFNIIPTAIAEPETIEGEVKSVKGDTVTVVVKGKEITFTINVDTRANSADGNMIENLGKFLATGKHTIKATITTEGGKKVATEVTILKSK
jgi:ribosome maturation factor RimP